jgi:hypothetical protein
LRLRLRLRLRIRLRLRPATSSIPDGCHALQALLLVRIFLRQKLDLFTDFTDYHTFNDCNLTVISDMTRLWRLLHFVLFCVTLVFEPVILKKDKIPDSYLEA